MRTTVATLWRLECAKCFETIATRPNCRCYETKKTTPTIRKTLFRVIVSLSLVCFKSM